MKRAIWSVFDLDKQNSKNFTPRRDTTAAEHLIDWKMLQSRYRNAITNIYTSRGLKAQIKLDLPLYYRYVGAEKLFLPPLFVEPFAEGAKSD